MNTAELETVFRAPMVPTVLPLAADILGAFARTLAEEGYPALEVLSRPPEQGFEVLRQINGRPERALVRWGLGTVTTEKVARQAASLRPDFLVSPAFSRRVLHVAAAEGLPYVPGVRTFQDVQDVLEAFEDEGLPLRVLKLCPIDGLSLDYVKMLSGCYPGILFCPTGEVTLDNYAHWRQLACIGAPLGSWFLPRELLEAGDWAAVRERLRSVRRLAGA